MFGWNSKAASAAFLFLLLSTDAVFGGIVQPQRAGLPGSEVKILGAPEKAVEENTPEIAETEEVVSVDSTNRLNDDENSADDLKDALLSENAEDTGDEFGDNNLGFGKRKEVKSRAGKEGDSAALNAVAYIAGTAATAFAAPFINTMPPFISRGIVGFASVLNSMAANNSTPTTNIMVVNSTYPEGQNASQVSQARGFPEYGFDGIVNAAAAWMRGDDMTNMDSFEHSLEELAPYSSFRGVESARTGTGFSMEPFFTVLAAIRRTVATEFFTTMIFVTVAHVIRIAVTNFPNILSVMGVGRTSLRSGTPSDYEMISQEWESPSDGSFRDEEFLRERVRKAEDFARQLVAAVTREQCAERAACLVGAHCSQYSVTPSVMKLLRSPEPNKERPDHPVWIAFRDAAESRVKSEFCDENFKC